MKKIRIYEYGNCSTCRKALKFLDQNKVRYERVPIVEQPPTVSELKKMLAFQNGELRKLFNTSGMAYRELKIPDRLPKMSQDEALTLLASHGKLVKRPFVLTDRAGLLGFREEEWKKFFP